MDILWAARQMSVQLKSRGYHVGRRRAGRCMKEIYAKQDHAGKVGQF